VVAALCEIAGGGGEARGEGEGGIAGGGGEIGGLVAGNPWESWEQRADLAAVADLHSDCVVLHFFSPSFSSR